MVCSFPFALVLALVLGFALLALPCSFWLLHVPFALALVPSSGFFIPFPFVLCPGTRQGIARFPVLCLRSLALFFLHPLLLVRPVYP